MGKSNKTINEKEGGSWSHYIKNVWGDSMRCVIAFA